MQTNYFFVFFTLSFTFIYVLISLLEKQYSSLDFTLFSVFIIVGMFLLINWEKKISFLLGIILFAFIFNYFIFLILQQFTLVRVILLFLNLLSFIILSYAAFQEDSKYSS